MGGNSSKTVDLLNVAECKRFERVPGVYIEHAQNVGDALLGFGKVVGDFSEVLDKSCVAYMTKKERDEFVELETKKMAVVDKVKVFILKEKRRFELVNKEAALNKPLKDLLRNVNPQQHIQHTSELQSQITKLQEEYAQFKHVLEENCKTDGRAAKDTAKRFTAFFAGLTMVAAGLGAVAFLVCHFLPGVNFVLCPLGWTAVATLTTTAIIGGAFMATACQASEIERAMQYMQKLQVNLAALKDGMQRLESDGTVITETGQLNDFKELNTSLIARCDQIVQVCDAISQKVYKA